MNNFKKNALSSILITSLLSGFSGCRDMIHDMNNISAEIPQIKSISMIEIPDVTNRISNGAFADLTPYKINAYETTYLLWFEVVQWAKQNGYNFVKSAEAGNSGEKGSLEIYALLPVTSCHPADIFTWCNACSEKNGLTPVYYKDKECNQILKNSADVSKEKITTDNTLIHDTSGNVLVEYDFELTKSIYQKKNANGFRLPSNSEWQYAAQGARRTTEDSRFTYAGSGDYKEVAVTGKMKIPGSLKPNGIGAYDMSGNIAEYTVPGSTSNDVQEITYNSLNCYGGHYLTTENKILSVQNPYDLHNIARIYLYLFGFRLAQSIIE